MPQEWSRRGVQVNKAFRLQASRCSVSYRASPHRHTMTRVGGGGGGRWRRVTRPCVDPEPTDALNVTNHQEARLLSAPGARKKRQGCCVTAATVEVWGKVGGGDGGRGGKYLNWDKSQLCNYQQTSFWCIFNSFFSLGRVWPNYGPRTIWSPLNHLIRPLGQT